jgi:hypothetical protein
MSRARAQDLNHECTQAAEEAQQLRIEGKLRAARTMLHACLDPVCPSLIRAYCTRWFDEVEAEMPSLLISVHDEAGNDLSDVVLTVDARVEESWRTGLPVELDPGEHVLRCERPHSKPAELQVRMTLSTKMRAVSIVLEEDPEERPVTPAATADVGVNPDKPPQNDLVYERRTSYEARSAQRWLVAGWTLVSTALTAYGTFAYLGISGHSRLTDLRNECAGHCASDQVDAAWRRLILADVALGVALVSTGLSVWSYFAFRRHRRSADGPAGKVFSSFDVEPSRTCLRIRFAGRF